MIMKKGKICMMLGLLALCSCKQQEYLYLADMVDDAGYVVANRHTTRIQDDDRLRITVSCKNPELAAPFNVSSSAVKVAANGTVQAASQDENVYRVNREGNISFPVLGELHLAGLSLIEASELIRNRIISGNYIKDPIVNIEFKNFHYTVLGSVGGNGTYTVDGDKVTILEAIAKAGDLDANADLENIAVIRESDGKRQLYNVDIRSTDLFNSPAFDLAQNDIIYARPKKKKTDGKAVTLQWVTVALSAISAISTVMWAVNSFKN